MGYPPLFSHSRRYFHLPKVYPGNLTDTEGDNSWQGKLLPLPIFFLAKSDEDKHKSTIKEIEGGNADDVWQENIKRPLAAVPWLRNYTPDINAIFDMVRDVDSQPCKQHMCIFIDEKGLGGRTCVVAHSLRPEGRPSGARIVYEFARVELSKAYILACTTIPDKSWFPDVLHEDCRVQEPDVSANPDDEREFVGREIEFNWPAHLPSHLKFEEKKPFIISLVHLSDGEMENLLEFIAWHEKAGEYENVRIINWPAAIEPASTSEIWHIFDRVMPDWPSQCGQVFGFFATSFHLTGSERRPDLCVARRERVHNTGESIPLHANHFRTENTMRMWKIPGSGFWATWRAAWSRGSGGMRRGIRENAAMRNVARHYSYTGFSSLRMPAITNPDLPVVRVTKDELPIFFLQSSNPTQEHMLRNWLLNVRLDDAPVQFVPGGDGTINSLMQYFQSPEFMQYHGRTPSTFIAIDKTAESAILSWNETDGEYPSVRPTMLLGKAVRVFHEAHGVRLAEDQVGYSVVRCEEYELYAECLRKSPSLDRPGERYYWDCFDAKDEELQSRINNAVLDEVYFNDMQECVEGVYVPV